VVNDVLRIAAELYALRGRVIITKEICLSSLL